MFLSLPRSRLKLKEGWQEKKSKFPETWHVTDDGDVLCLACLPKEKSAVNFFMNASAPLCQEHLDQTYGFFDMEPLEHGKHLCKHCGEEITGNLHLCLGKSNGGGTG